MKLLTSKTLNRSDLIIVLSQTFKDDLTSIDVDESRISLSSTMVDTKGFQPTKKEIKKPMRILFCSRMAREKGPYEVLQSIKIVKKKYPRARFWFIGDGPALDDLKDLSKKLKITESVKFLGYVSRSRKIKVFQMSHIFLFPTYYSEGFPTVIIEAMASGNAIISTKNAGITRAIHNGHNGYLLSTMPANPKEIAELIVHLIENEMEVRLMSSRNVKASGRYDVGVVTKAIETHYSRIIKVNG